MASWHSPDSFYDEQNLWTNEALAYDGDTGTYAWCPQNGNMWQQWCRFIFTTPIVDASKLRFWVSHAADASLRTVDIHLHKTDEVSQSIYQSIPVHDQWVEVTGVTLTPISYIRVRFEGLFVQYGELRLNELGLWAPDAPVLSSAIPNSAKRLETRDIVLAGQYLTGATVVDFGALITTNLITVDSDIQITANITVGAAAALGLRDVSVTTPSGTGILSAGFTVNPADTPVSASGGAYFARRVARFGF